MLLASTSLSSSLRIHKEYFRNDESGSDEREKREWIATFFFLKKKTPTLHLPVCLPKRNRQGFPKLLPIKKEMGQSRRSNFHNSHWLLINTTISLQYEMLYWVMQQWLQTDGTSMLKPGLRAMLFGNFSTRPDISNTFICQPSANPALVHFWLKPSLQNILK